MISAVVKLLLIGLLTSLACFWAHRMFVLLRPFTTVYNHAPGPCRTLIGIVDGAEDIQALSNGQVLISSGLKKAYGNINKYQASRRGRIYLYDITKPDVNPVALKMQGIDLDSFNPHGISIWTDKKTGSIYLYVVNHPNAVYDAIEKFLFVEKDKLLIHKKTIKDENLHFLNDVVVVGEDEFYATNSAYTHSELGFMFELYSLVKWASIVYYDGVSSRQVATNLRLANGINVSPDHRYLYLGDMYTQEVVTYEIFPDKNLKKSQGFPLYTGVDNLDIDPQTGDIWVGAHPVGWKLLMNLETDHRNATHPPPSQVLRLKVKDGLPVSVTEVYADDGAVLQASSVAVRYKNSLLIGTVSYKALHCEIKYLGD